MVGRQGKEGDGEGEQWLWMCMRIKLNVFRQNWNEMPITGNAIMVF